MLPRAGVFCTLVLLLMSGCIAPGAPTTNADVRLATTTSMRDSGLLDVLVEQFEAESGLTVEYVAVGTGAALNLGRNGDVDALIVHAPDQETTFVEDGYGLHRTQIAWNAFVLLSPVALPVTLDAALNFIVEEEHCFVSRGDNSGTHMKEQELWQRLAQGENLTLVDNGNGHHPEGNWYLSIGQSMGAAINMADEKGCITLSDRGTALQFQEQIDLTMHEFDDTSLYNPYSFLPVGSSLTPGVELFEAYLIGSGRSTIENYTINGEPAFFV
jgi:tungstate transport system substrate-binding protein